MSNPSSLMISRPSVVREAARVISERLKRKEWVDFLPAERELCDLLGVSRFTLRIALRQLQAEGWVRIEHGKRTRILKTQVRARAAVRGEHPVIVALTTIADRSHLQIGAFWLDDFRQMAAKAGMMVVFEFVPVDAQRPPEDLLVSLREKYKPFAWLLVASDRRLHEIFHRLKWPMLVGGSMYADIPLPCIDVDYQAVCRHAVGQLARLGHRRVGLVSARSTLPGDMHSMRGFEEGLAAHRGTEIEGIMLHVGDTADSVLHTLQREYTGKHPATALIVCRPQVTICTLTVLASLGRSVPKDVSLIARDHNPALLAWIWPSLASYRSDPVTSARKALSIFRGILAGNPVEARQHFLIPEYRPAASVAALP